MALGYSEQSVFTRSFRRCYGGTPLRYCLQNVMAAPLIGSARGSNAGLVDPGRGRVREPAGPGLSAEQGLNAEDCAADQRPEHGAIDADVLQVGADFSFEEAGELLGLPTGDNLGHVATDGGPQVACQA